MKASTWYLLSTYWKTRRSTLTRTTAYSLQVNNRIIKAKMTEVLVLKLILSVPTQQEKLLCVFMHATWINLKIWRLLFPKQVGPTPKSNSILKCILSWVCKSWLGLSWYDLFRQNLFRHGLSWLDLTWYCILIPNTILVHHSSYMASIGIPV